MPVHFTPMRWEIGSPFEKYFDALLTASWAGVSEHSMPLRQSETLKYNMHILWHLPWMKKYLQYLLRHIGKRPMKAIITESKLFPSLLSQFPVKRRQICESIQINLLWNQIWTLCRSLEGNNTRLVCVQMNKGGKVLKKLWCCVGGRV